MNKCHICKHKKVCLKQDLVDAETCEGFVHITNFENITTSPEALAKFINDAANLAYREQCFIPDPCYGTDCERCITKWLKQEAEQMAVEKSDSTDNGK